MNPIDKLRDALTKHQNVYENIERSEMIAHAIDNREAIVCESGALATWSRPESTGRSPKDTYMVKRPISEGNIDWTSANNLPIEEKVFDMIFEDAVQMLMEKPRAYVTDRVVGADSDYALPVKTVTSSALHTVFIDNMFRPIPADIHKSIFHKKDFLLLCLPYNKLDKKKYDGMLRKLPDGTTSDLIVAMDYDRHCGVIVGSSYCGSMKKMIFTVMDYYLPLEGILPLHCSANEGKNGDSALLLGLSGTGKTTLSADPNRALLGDDEHGWDDKGIANFEYGCFAKMIDINPKKEPDIYDAVMHKAEPTKHGAILENAMVYPNGEVDFYDDRLTENSRASYPLSFLKNIKESSCSGHPSTILFLTADAYGVLPPVSILNKEQAMLWFLMGYTSKLAGTETGIVEPQATFSRFFGAPFMPCNPNMYSDLLGEKMEKHNTQVFLINTGWTGGGFGVGKRFDLVYTRKMVDAALDGSMNINDYTVDDIFHLHIPKHIEGVPDEMLVPINTWQDKDAYHIAAKKLAEQFAQAFKKSYGNKNISQEIAKYCPGL
ncbi:phosphoenolpyruvate carboxykinase (ATP) [Bacteroidales bacterium OttesenSCG-928-K22]|nr:phosphoenolpyruvate carboxykinase (ATP) [Bacteroidales bacterium OttesenSCG-928-K22]